MSNPDLSHRAYVIAAPFRGSANKIGRLSRPSEVILEFGCKAGCRLDQKCNPSQVQEPVSHHDDFEKGKWSRNADFHGGPPAGTPSAISHWQMLLLVDDDHNFREALGVLLRGDGYHVEEFPDPGHVPPLESLPTIQALVVDHEMPGESGLAFADRFHRALPAVPIVMVTSYPVEELKHLLAARPHITLRHKPIDYDELAGLLPAPP